MKQKLAKGIIALTTVFLLVAMPACCEATVSRQQLVYGSGIGSKNLSNAALYQDISFRFKAEHPGTVQKIVFYLVFAPNGYYPGYFQGDGGQVLVQLQTDDGTENHFPSGAVLGSWLIKHPMDRNNRDYEGVFADSNKGAFPIIPLEPAPQLEEGKLYHIVFSDPAANPDCNFVSVETLINCEYHYEPYTRNPMPCGEGTHGGNTALYNTYCNEARSSMQPRYSDEELAVLSRDQGGQWKIEQAFTPIYALYFTDGYSQGQEYMEVEVSGENVPISGGNIAKETFTVSAGNKTVTAVSVRLAKKGDILPALKGGASLNEVLNVQLVDVPLSSHIISCCF